MTRLERMANEFARSTITPNYHGGETPTPSEQGALRATALTFLTGARAALSLRSALDAEALRIAHNWMKTPTSGTSEEQYAHDVIAQCILALEARWAEMPRGEWPTP